MSLVARQAERYDDAVFPSAWEAQMRESMPDGAAFDPGNAPRLFRAVSRVAISSSTEAVQYYDTGCTSIFERGKRGT